MLNKVNQVNFGWWGYGAVVNSFVKHFSAYFAQARKFSLKQI